VALTSGESGSASDLETRIDQQPASRVGTQPATGELAAQLERAQLTAVLQLEQTQTAQNGVFVRPHTVLVFTAAADWNADAVRAAMQRALQPGLTASQIGIDWVKSGPLYRLGGLAPIVTSTQGKYLFLSDDETLLNAVLAKSSGSSRIQAAGYLAGFNHAGERPEFVRFANLVHRTPAASGNPSAPNAEQPREGDEPAQREPDYFSGNIGSLSATWKDVSLETMVVRQVAGLVRQTVTYKWSK
jgi:hypothetical protein